MEKNKDRISALPEFIIHQILSYLSNKEAAQKTALSKTWLQAWSTTPFLILNEQDYLSGSPEIRENYFSRFSEIEAYRYKFFNFVNDTLLRYRSQNLRIHKFEILVLRADQAIFCRLLDLLIKTALDHGVKDLHISASATFEFPSYILPPTLFTSVNALTVLRVSKCKFPQNFATTSNAINFPFLKTLVLWKAYIDDGMLEKLFSSCPSIEKVIFKEVLGFKRFLVRNLGELKLLFISPCNEGIEVDIQSAPSLRALDIQSAPSHWDSFKIPCLLKVGSAQNLRLLELVSVNITHNFLEELVSDCPLLEYLENNMCDGLERVNISSRSLKHLRFLHCKKLVEAKIDAPNLLTLQYVGENVLSLSLHNTPEELMTYIHIAHSGLARPKNTWFHQLRELLKSVSRASVSLSIRHHGVQFGTDLDLRANPLPLENFMPEIDQSFSVFAAVLETLFSSSRPTTISTGLRLAPAFVDFIKFLGNVLIMATRISYCCVLRRSTKCWRHSLKDLKIEVYENSQNAWQPLHWETFLVESIFHDKKIRFSLKWNAHN